MSASRFANQVAVVTGGADGLGRGIALRLAQEGAAVAIFDFNEAKMDEAAAAISATGARVATFKVDVADEAAVQRAIAAVAKDFGRLDIMINCAGIVGQSGSGRCPWLSRGHDADDDEDEGCVKDCRCGHGTTLIYICYTPLKAGF